MRYLIVFFIFMVPYIHNVKAQTAELERVYNNAFAHHYINKDSAYYYYEQTIRLADEQNELEYILSAYIYLMNANGHYYDLENYQKNLKKEDSLLHYDPRFKSLGAKG